MLNLTLNSDDYKQKTSLCKILKQLWKSNEISKYTHLSF